MAMTRKHIGFNESLKSVVEQLAEKWQMDFSSAVRHCIVVVAEKEGIGARRLSRSGKKISLRESN